MRIKNIKIKRIYHRALSFGIRPRTIPHANAQAIAPGSRLELKAFNNFAIGLNIGRLYHAPFLCASLYKKAVETAKNLLKMKLGTHKQIAEAVDLPLKRIDKLARELSAKAKQS